MKSLILLAALAACKGRDERPEPPVIDPGPALLGGGGPSVKFYRHVLRADGRVVGEVVVIYIPQR